MKPEENKSLKLKCPGCGYECDPVSINFKTGATLYKCDNPTPCKNLDRIMRVNEETWIFTKPRSSEK